MRKVVMLRDYRDYKEGDLIEVHPNEAHGLIEAGYGRLADEQPEERVEKPVAVEQRETKEMTAAPKPRVKTEEDVFICVECGKTYKSEGWLKKHMESAHKGSYSTK